MKWALAALTIGGLTLLAPLLKPKQAPNRAATEGSGPPPHLASGSISVKTNTTNLAQQIRNTPGPAWVGYSIAAVPGHRGCCTSIRDGVCSTGCALEGGSFIGSACPAAQSDNSTAYLEGERTVNILVRVDHGEVERVQVYSPSCQLDIGNLTLYWLTNVQSADSVAFLRSLATPNGPRVVSAIGAHADPAADAFLRETAESQAAQKRDRERAATMLASTRGAAGMSVVLKLLRDDPDEQFRSTLPNALAQVPANEGTPALIDAALKDRNRMVRERAFFWLGRSKDPRAQKFVAEILSK